METNDQEQIESVILEEEIDENYEPNSEEIRAYAQYLGMNLDQDKEFLDIAREGLKAPLPEPWRACRTKSGEIYYFNFETGDSVWEHPLDNIYRQKYQMLKLQQTALKQQQQNPEAIISTNLPNANEFNSKSKSLSGQQRNPQTRSPDSSFLNQTQSNVAHRTALSYSNTNDNSILSGLSNSNPNLSIFGHQQSLNSDFVSGIEKKKNLINDYAKHGERNEMLIADNEICGELKEDNFREESRKFEKKKVENIPKFGSIIYAIEETKSISFSEMNAETDKKSNDEDYSKIYRDIENEFDRLLKAKQKKLELELEKIKNENEKNFQMESDHIISQVKNELEEYKKTLQSEKSSLQNADETKDPIKQKEKLAAKLQKEFDDILEIQKGNFELEIKQLEISEEEQTVKSIKETEDNLRLEHMKKEGLEKKINELKIQKEKLLVEKNLFENKIQDEIRLFEREKLNLESENNYKLRVLEADEEVKMEKEISSLRRDLQENFEKEKISILSKNEEFERQFAIKKIELCKFYDENFYREKIQRNEENDRLIYEMELIEKQRIDDDVDMNFYCSVEYKTEMEKQQNAIEIEKILYEESMKRKMDDFKQDYISSCELEIKDLQAKYDLTNNKLKKDLNSLCVEIANKENFNLHFNTLKNECYELESALRNKNNILAKTRDEWLKVQGDLATCKAEILRYYKLLENQKNNLTYKQSLSKNIDYLYEMITMREKEIQEFKKAQEKTNLISEYKSPGSKSNSSSIMHDSQNVQKILMEVEEIKNTLMTNNKRAISLGRRHQDKSRSYEKSSSSIANTRYKSKRNLNIIQPMSESIRNINNTQNYPNALAEQSQNVYISNLDSIIDEVKTPIKQVYRNPNRIFVRNTMKKDQWIDLVNQEKKYIENITQKLKLRKSKAKELQDELKEEQTRFKLQYQKVKDMSSPNMKLSSEKMKLENEKKKINENIKKYNETLNDLRNDEKKIFEKELALSKIEDYIRDMINWDQSDKTHILQAYQDYLSIKINPNLNDTDLQSMETINLTERSNSPTNIKTENSHPTQPIKMMSYGYSDAKSTLDNSLDIRQFKKLDDNRNLQFSQNNTTNSGKVYDRLKYMTQNQQSSIINGY